MLINTRKNHITASDVRSICSRQPASAISGPPKPTASNSGTRRRSSRIRLAPCKSPLGSPAEKKIFMIARVLGQDRAPYRHAKADGSVGAIGVDRRGNRRRHVPPDRDVNMRPFDDRHVHDRAAAQQLAGQVRLEPAIEPARGQPLPSGRAEGSALRRQIGSERQARHAETAFGDQRSQHAKRARRECQPGNGFAPRCPAQLFRAIEIGGRGQESRKPPQWHVQLSAERPL